MGNPLQDAENALGEIFNDVQTKRTTFEEDFIQPLQLFPQQHVDELDIIHDQCVTSVQTSIGKLFGPGGNFKGDAASAISQTIDHYFEQESKLSHYVSDDVSEYMIHLAQVCIAAVKDMEPHLEALKGASTSNVVVNDVLTYWSNVMRNGPQALIDGLQVGPWTIGQITQGQIFSGSQPQHANIMAPQTSAPQTGTPVSGFWEEVAAILAPFSALIVVVNIVTEAIKQLGLDWHMESLALIALRWVQQMNDLHSNVLLQNSNSSMFGDASGIVMTLRNANAKFLFQRTIGMPDPNLSPDKKQLAQQLYQYYAEKFPGLLTLTEIEYIVAAFPATIAKEKVIDLATLKIEFPKLPDGYLAFFVIQNIPYSQIKQDVQWLQKASQNVQGTGPGNIYYMHGKVPSNPYVDFLTAETYSFEAQGANQLRTWMHQVLTGEMSQVDINSVKKGAVKTFLQRTYDNRRQIALYDPNNPATAKYLPGGYQGFFGTATQELVKVKIRQAPWYGKGKQYIEDDNLLVDRGGGPLRPDLQLKLRNGNWAALDYTTYDQLKTKSKYNQQPYSYNIVLIHNGPFGGDEFSSQN